MRPIYFKIFLAVVLFDCFAALPAAETAAPVRPLGSRLELFVDHHLIDTLSHTELRLNQPVDAGTVLRFDKPWEGAFCNYLTVLKDGPTYRLYYRGLPVAGPDGGPKETTCYAESDDGINWRKPDLGIFEINGDRHNNVVLDHSFAPVSHNFCPMIDTRPGVPASERYKGLGGLYNYRDTNGKMVICEGLQAFASPDGIHWRRLRPEAVITRENYPVVTSDTSLTPSFWSESEGCYVAYLRTWREPATGALARQHGPGDIRWIGRVTSPDFIHWSKIEMMSFGDAPLDQLYNNVTSPYFRAPHIYVGAPPLIVFDRPLVTVEQARVIGVDPDQSRDASEPVLISSRGGTRYDRTFLEPFIRNGIGPENWTSRNNYSALNFVPTGRNEMSLYIEQAYAQPGCHLQRYVLPLDRFASVHAAMSGGEFTTHPLTFSGRSLFLNYSTSVSGSIRVEIQDAAGRPIPGFTLVDSIETVGNEIEHTAAWKGGAKAHPRTWQGDPSRVSRKVDFTEWEGGDDLSHLAGKTIRLRFVMKGADLYALRFR
ncbi:MAG: hypothetical protein EXS38_04980 [Opitutus sp.]|nr:hypothetical protein [Opitutus sp.]